MRRLCEALFTIVVRLNGNSKAKTGVCTAMLHTQRRYVVDAILLAVLIAGLRIWGDVDEATTYRRHAELGPGVVSYRSPGRTIGFFLNVPVAAFCNVVLPHPLPWGEMKGVGWREWTIELAVVAALAVLTGLFWWLAVAISLRIRRRTPTRHRLLLLNLNIVLGFAFTFFGIMFGKTAGEAIRSLPEPYLVAFYIRRGWLCQEYFLDRLQLIVITGWCVAIAAFFFWCAMQLYKRGAVSPTSSNC